MRASARGLPWWWTLVPSFGVSGVAMGVFTTDHLVNAGLAPLAISTLFAVFIGAQLARDSWTSDGSASTTRAVEVGFLDVAIWGSLASVVSTNLHKTPEIALLVLGVALFVYGIPARFRVASWAGSLSAVLVVGLVASSFRFTPGWSLLTPDFSTWRVWSSTALTVGALLSWVPTFWTKAPSPAPARSNVPFLSTGISLISLLGLAWFYAATAEHQLGEPSSLPISSLFGILATITLLRVPVEPPQPHRLSLLGLMLLVYFFLSGMQPLWWALLCPVLLGSASGLHALRERSPVWAVTSALLLCSVFVSTGGFPDSIQEGFFAMFPWIVAIWVAGTRALLAETS